MRASFCRRSRFVNPCSACSHKRSTSKRYPLVARPGVERLDRPAVLGGCVDLHHCRRLGHAAAPSVGVCRAIEGHRPPAHFPRFRVCPDQGDTTPLGLPHSYLIRAITSFRAPRKGKALGLPGLLSGRRDLNPRRSPWQAASMRYAFDISNVLGGAQFAKGSESWRKGVRRRLAITSFLHHAGDDYIMQPTPVHGARVWHFSGSPAWYARSGGPRSE